MRDVRITLEQPYARNPDGSERTLLLRYGTSEARILGQASAIAIGSSSYDGDDLVDVGTFQQHAPRPVPTVIPGKRIEYALCSCDEERNGIIVPMDAARLWFGDWRIPREPAVNTPVEDTYGFERNRVALRWGFWKMPQKTQDGLSHLRRGEGSADTTKIGPPDVPHVLIEDIDQRGKSTGKLHFRPWEFFRWQDDVVSMQGHDTPRAATSLEAYSLDDLQQFIDAKRKAEEKKTKA